MSLVIWCTDLVKFLFILFWFLWVFSWWYYKIQSFFYNFSLLIFIVFCHCELKTNFICHKCQGWRLSVLYFLIYFVSFALQLRPSILIIYWLLGKYHRNNQVTKVAWLYIKTNLILTWNFLLFFNYIKSINGWIVLQFYA